MRVLLVPNLGNPSAVAATSEVAGWLAAEGLEPVLVSSDADGAGLSSYGVSPTDVGEPGLVVAFGGDGTILKAVHVLGEVESPILGVNFGRLGFLAGAHASKMRESITAALAGEVAIERRATIDAEVMMGGRNVGRYRALNEVALLRGSTGRVIEVDVAVDGVSAQRVRCDGMIVATPTGSTAYALSAGGPIVSPDVGCSLVVPVAPHTLAARTLVLGSFAQIELRLPDPARRDACVQVDGDVTPCRRDIDSVLVRRCAHDVLLAKLDGRDFIEVVRGEFLGG